MKTFDLERTTDRISVIPFTEWGTMDTTEFTEKQGRFNSLMASTERPTEYIIGEIGDFIMSEEFATKRIEMADLLLAMTEEVVKLRTLTTNYACFYTILWKMHQVF